MAKHVFEYTFKDPSMFGDSCAHCGKRGYEEYDVPWEHRCYYSTDDDAAKAVVWAMWEKGFSLSLLPVMPYRSGESSVRHSYTVEFTWFLVGRAECVTFPLAVCIAALRALGIEVSDGSRT